MDSKGVDISIVEGDSLGNIILHHPPLPGCSLMCKIKTLDKTIILVDRNNEWITSAGQAVQARVNYVLSQPTPLAQYALDFSNIGNVTGILVMRFGERNNVYASDFL